MSTLIPMFVSLLVWIVLWGYVYRLDRKVKDLDKNA
jgi:hypothetical protein